MEREADVATAAEVLAAGGLVVIPTDTVYGIAAALTPAAVARVFRVKGRPLSKPLPVLAARPEDLSRIVTIDSRAQRLAGAYWPGPLTLVLPRAAGFELDLGGDAGRGVAVRVPEHPLALELLTITGSAAVTSANRSGEPPFERIADARVALGGEIDAYLDGGTCAGRPSTVFSLIDRPEVLRAGPVPEEELLAHL